MTSRIYNTDLIYNGKPASFVIQTMEGIDAVLQGVADDPHRHSYYTVIWPLSGSGRHIIDFREYPIISDHLFFVSPDQVHQLIIEGHPTGFVIQFTCAFLEKYGIREEFIANLKTFQEQRRDASTSGRGNHETQVKNVLRQYVDVFYFRR